MTLKPFGSLDFSRKLAGVANLRGQGDVKQCRQGPPFRRGLTHQGSGTTVANQYWRQTTSLNRPPGTVELERGSRVASLRVRDAVLLRRAGLLGEPPLYRQQHEAAERQARGGGAADDRNRGGQRLSLHLHTR